LHQHLGKMGRRIRKTYLIPELDISAASSDGRGIGRLDGQVVFVEGAIPGDRVAVEVYRKEKRNLIGRLQQIVSPSPSRRVPECRHFPLCRGCTWQMMIYTEQLRIKHDQVVEAIRRIGKTEPQKIQPILGNETPFWFRNKLEFSFGSLRFLTIEEMDRGLTPESENALGFNIRGHFNKILQVDECLLQTREVNPIKNAVRDFSVRNSFSFYDNKAHTGILRNLVFRTSNSTGEMMIILVTSIGGESAANEISRFTRENYPVVTSFIHLVNDKINNSYYDQPWTCLYGNPWITESLGRWNFRIGPVSFFQTNTNQAIRLYDIVRNFCGQSKQNIIYDLYCGAGSIGIYLSDLAEKIIGIEFADEAVADARQNVILNGLFHLSFYSGDMKKILTEDFISKEGAPDLVITDPPRAGMEKSVIEQLMKLSPPAIIYVSCNPATQARDIELMGEKYLLAEIQPVDMFPHTKHVESVALLKFRYNH